jgi:hypothetical protein
MDAIAPPAMVISRFNADPVSMNAMSVTGLLRRP